MVTICVESHYAELWITMNWVLCRTMNHTRVCRTMNHTRVSHRYRHSRGIITIFALKAWKGGCTSLLQPKCSPALPEWHHCFIFWKLWTLNRRQLCMLNSVSLKSLWPENGPLASTDFLYNIINSFVYCLEWWRWGLIRPMLIRGLNWSVWSPNHQNWWKCLMHHLRFVCEKGTLQGPVHWFVLGPPAIWC